MTIQPDHWIRKMAHEHGMIEPFVEKQVSTHVISYGVSSYGYDIRVADEFKIFTNVFSAIVDPKHFDPKSMVDFKGDVCIIPPNSFVLARTIEYFRIPRNVLDDLRGQIDVCALRADRQRHALRAGMGRLRHAGNQQHHAPARQGLLERRHRAGAVLRRRRRVRDLVQRSQGQVRQADRRGAAEDDYVVG